MDDSKKGIWNCCTPSRDGSESNSQSTAAAGEPRAAGVERDADARFITNPTCSFLMGSNDPAAHPLDRETPVRLVSLKSFALDAVAVSNRRFAHFIEATGYRTEAERFGWSFVFVGILSEAECSTTAAVGAPWWRQVHGACWRHPEGPCSSIDGRLEHPVVHVSHNDALAYCAWAGARLPTEAEWECAARGGLTQMRYPWGNELTPDGRHRCNIWQGTFPHHDSGEDGFAGTAPVDAFKPNALGFYNVVGNVWEWCADWFDCGPFTARDPNNPRDPLEGSARVTRGGSYLCHQSYCFRYRVSARASTPPDSSTGHIGFRVAHDM